MAKIKGGSVFVLVALATSQLSLAALPEKLSLRVEASSSKLATQYALIFDKDKLTLGLNSNTFCGPSQEVSLGHFETNLDSIQRSNFQFLKQIVLRFQPQTNKQEDPSVRSSLRFFLNNIDISSRENALRTAKRIISESCEPHTWIAKKAVLVDVITHEGQKILRQRFYKDNAQTALTLTPLAQAHCEKAGETSDKRNVLDCLISNYGMARLIVQK